MRMRRSRQVVTIRVRNRGGKELAKERSARTYLVPELPRISGEASKSEEMLADIDTKSGNLHNRTTNWH